MKSFKVCSILILSMSTVSCIQPRNSSGVDDKVGNSEERATPPLCASWDGDTCRPLTFALLSEPKNFNGVKLQIAGYAIWGERGLVVYPSLDMACSQTDSVGVQLDFGLNLGQATKNSLAERGVVSITVSGVFDSEMNGLNGRYIGHITDTDIVNLDVPRSSLRTDPQELVGVGRTKSVHDVVTLTPPSCS